MVFFLYGSLLKYVFTCFLFIWGKEKSNLDDFIKKNTHTHTQGHKKGRL